MEYNATEWITNRISQGAEQGRLLGGALLVEATNIAGRCQIAGCADKIQEPVNRKERSFFNEQLRPLEENALIGWAHSQSIIATEEIFLKQ